ncbi:hypothetical protein [Pareuzebyella sediminis]|uniref:hypothetical protein n=1 Tax=Pareuzebyella sediminis TaxID=2607998 RepID=UPI0011EC285D|nr:hypothetical protein [Pareuzebyella sediminis]
MKHFFIVLIVLIGFKGIAQDQLNDYKYIIVPKKFEEFKRVNQYQTSTLVKHLFTKSGFTAVYNDELPSDLNNNRCLGLMAHLVDDSSLFTTKTTLVLKDCTGKEVYATMQGKSKEKDYKNAYNEALRDAFSSLETVNYAYNGKAGDSRPVSVSFENDVKDAGTTNTEGADLKPSKNQNAMVTQQATPENQSYVDKRPKPSDFKKAEPGQVVIAQPAIQQSQDKTTLPESKVVGRPIQRSRFKSDMGTLYAQELDNGYQLVDSTPKIRLKIFKSSKPNFFMAEGEGRKGVLYQKDDKWLFEYYSGDELITEELNIKF